MTNKHILLASAILLSVALAFTYFSLSDSNKSLNGSIISLSGRFILPEMGAKGCVSELYTEGYGLNMVLVYPNFSEGESSDCLLQKKYDKKEVIIKGKLEYLACIEGSQCRRERWAVTSVESIQIVGCVSENDVKRDIEAANYCDADRDCIIVSFGCPFGCASYVNAGANLTKIRGDVERYNLCTGAVCEYKCMQPKDPVCSGGKCIDPSSIR
jgi:hypothetical protein